LSFADFVGVNSCTTAASNSSNSRALFAPGNAANQGTAERSASGSKLIAMLLPEASAMVMAIADTSVMSVPVIAVSMSEIPAGPAEAGTDNSAINVNTTRTERIFLISSSFRRFGVATGEYGFGGACCQF